MSDGGRLGGLRAIGFHGEVDPAQTPGRREAILVDDAWHLIGLEPMGSDGGTDISQAVWGQVGSQVEPGTLPGIATPLLPPFPAHLGHIIVVLGTMELAHVDALADVEPHVEAPHVNALLRWLREPTSSPPADVLVQRRGEMAIWYCSVEDAFALYQRICRLAEMEMVRASNEDNKAALYQASWWLARAALDDSDRYFAAIGLERSDRSIADAYLKATFRRRSAEEIEIALRHARGVFDDRCTDAKRRLTASVLREDSTGFETAASRGQVPTIGATLGGARTRMRQQYVVLQRRAA